MRKTAVFFLRHQSYASHSLHHKMLNELDWVTDGVLGWVTGGVLGWVTVLRDWEVEILDWVME
jgi:hypothetical protein